MPELRNEIYLIDENNEEMILASKKDGRWVCRLCDEDELLRTRMIHHVRFSHILIR